MEKIDLDYTMQKYNGENVELMLSQMGFNTNNYFITMTKPSLLSRVLVGNIVDFANRYCIVCFTEAEINLIMLSRLDSKKVTELIKINRSEISGMKLSDIFISYTLKVTLNDSKMNFQVFKKVGGFPKIKEAINLFRSMYNI